ncbi:hypothetical protein [Geofilum rubicundum]|nr:hypothetical protein [Geofilum rubicundum]
MIALLWGGCKPTEENPMSEPIVTVDNVSLTLGELRRSMPDNLAPQDSVAMAEDYISRWVRTKLMLRQAEINLSAEEKDVEKLLEDYRTSLLVHLYQQKILEQKHSPLVTSREIEEYYLQMKDNFNLQESIIQGVFIKVPKNAPNQDQLRRWYRSTDAEDLINLEAYSFQYARNYEQFIENWVPFSRINSYLPEPILNEERFLRWSRHHETSDDDFNYYLAIHEYELPGDTAPVKYVEERLKAILLNKKRIEFIQQLGQDLYEEALREKIVNFHK